MGDDGNGKWSAFKRFGGEWSWNLSGERRLNIGDAITGVGPGEGFAMVPWALDRYEGTLRLKPVDSWLLRRMLAHAWEFGSTVYLSIRKMSLETDVARSVLSKHARRLEELGLIRRLPPDETPKGDYRIHYDVSAAYVALAIAIACDPTSEWAKQNGGPLTIAEAQRLTHRGIRFNFDWGVLQKLIARQGEELES